MKDGDGKKLAKARSQLPTFPGEKEDVFIKMAQLFIDTYDDLVRAMTILEIRSKHYVEARQDYVDNLLVRYDDTMKEYHELLFAEPEEK